MRFACFKLFIYPIGIFRFFQTLGFLGFHIPYRDTVPIRLSNIIILFVIMILLLLPPSPPYIESNILYSTYLHCLPIIYAICTYRSTHPQLVMVMILTWEVEKFPVCKSLRIQFEWDYNNRVPKNFSKRISIFPWLNKIFFLMSCHNNDTFRG